MNKVLAEGALEIPAYEEEDVLGLEKIWQTETGATGFKVGNGPIIIVDSKKESPESNVEFNFETKNIKHAYSALKSAGVEVGDIKVVGSTSMFNFKDHDGHTMMVWSDKLPE